MSLISELNKAFRTNEIKRSKHLFPLTDSPFKNKDLIEGSKVILSKNMTMSKITKKFEKILILRGTLNYHASRKIKTSQGNIFNI